MIRVSVLAFVIIAAPAMAQDQQAGNAASTNTEETFQALIDKCDDVDALMLRARIRLQLPRTTEEAAETAQAMLDDGFATCGAGDLEGAKAILSEALELAEAGTSETFGTEETAAEETAVETASEDAADASDEEQSKPWWKFW